MYGRRRDRDAMLSSLRNNDPREQVRDHAADNSAGDDRQHQPDQAYDRGIDVQIFADAAAHARDFRVRGGKRQLLVRAPLLLPRAARRTITGLIGDFPAAMRTEHISPPGNQPQAVLTIRQVGLHRLIVLLLKSFEAQSSTGHQGLKPFPFDGLDVAAEAATHKDYLRDNP